MSDDGNSSEKTEQPTAKKLEEARKKGEIPKSNELIFASSLVGLIAAVFILRADANAKFFNLLSGFISEPELFTSNKSHAAALNASVISILSITMVFLLPIGTVLLAAFAQRAIQISPNKVTPKLRKISPMSGLKNKFGAVGLVEFLKSSAKLVIVMVVLSLLFARDFFQLGNLSTLPVQTAVLFTLKKVLELTLYVLLALIAIGITDFIWQNFNHIKKNMMTRKEVEDEHKEAEGDPHLKGRRRQRAQQIALSQVISSVPEADVIIVNPTHYAVALKWDALSGRPPFCVTKGTDEIALKIRQTANDCGVPIYRSPSLARSIFASVEIGQHIQPNNYRAVAAAIRFAQRMRRR